MLFSLIDVETTGLTNHPEAHLDKQPKIIEFGGIITDGQNVLEELSFFCNPMEKLEPIITKITGITDAMLDDQPTFNHYLKDIQKFFESAQARVAHNLSFDKNLLRFELERRELDLFDIQYYPAIEICTVEQTFHQFGKRMKLEQLAEIYCPHFTQQSHRALDDAHLLHEVCKAIGIYEVFAVQ